MGECDCEFGRELRASTMAFEPVVHDVAEKVGQRLSRSDTSNANVCPSLAPDAECRVREVLQDARKLMRHGKRNHLNRADVNRALFLRRAEPVYARTAHGDAFEQPRGRSDVYVPKDADAQLQAEADGAFVPSTPTAPNLVAHWLCVDGQMPNIPENPSPEEQQKAADYASAVAPHADDERTAAASARADEGISKPDAEPAPVRTAADRAGLANDEHAARDQSGQNAVRLPVAHALPQEVQLFGEKLAEALSKCHDYSKPLHAALDALRRERAVTQLAPYLVRFFAQQAAAGGACASNAISGARALLCNQHVNLAPYLHELIPPILTCAVAKKLVGTRTVSHWEIRDSAAVALALLVQRYASSHPSIRPRAARTLCKALTQSNRPPASVYGAVQCLRALGQRTVRSIIVPNALGAFRNVMNSLHAREEYPSTEGEREAEQGEIQAENEASMNEQDENNQQREQRQQQEQQRQHSAKESNKQWEQRKKANDVLHALGAIQLAMGTELQARLLLEREPEEALAGDDTGPELQKFLEEVGEPMDAFVPSSVAVYTFV